MFTRRSAACAAAIALVLSAAATTSSGAAVSAKTYGNCTKLNKDYPHGVGRSGAHDKTSGKPVTNFKVNKSLYQANSGSDRDGDGIACEKK